MEVTVAALVYCLTILIPINGFMVLFNINERKKMRKILRAMWKMTARRPR